MAVFPIRFSETARKKLCYVLWGLLWLCAICGFYGIVIGVYFKIRLQDKMTLIEGYNDSTLPFMLVFVGGVTVIIDLAGGKLCRDLSDIALRSKHRKVLLPYLLVFAVLTICIFAAGCLCFAHRVHLNKSFHRGILKAMRSFKDKKEVKTDINQLQVEFECCGNDGYEDWFTVQWIADEYLDTSDSMVQSKMSDGIFLNDDVPYSCCKHDTLRPCIHHHVHDNDRHYNYDYRTQITLHGKGCKHALMDYFTNRLNPMGAITMILFAVQVSIFLLLRYLQTSIDNAYADENPDGIAAGWLLAKNPLANLMAAGKAADKAEVDETDDGKDMLSEDSSFGIDFNPEGPDWGETNEPSYLNVKKSRGSTKSRAGSSKNNNNRMKNNNNNMIKNKNNNIESDTFSSDESSAESDCSQTPLLSSSCSSMNLHDEDLESISLSVQGVTRDNERDTSSSDEWTRESDCSQTPLLRSSCSSLNVHNEDQESTLINIED